MALPTLNQRLATILTGIWIALTGSAFGATTAVPSAGVTLASAVVGGAGVTNGVFGVNGGGFFNRLITGVGGAAVLVADPLSATFQSGFHVIRYPEEFLSVQFVGWFGEFALDPSVPPPPVVNTAFFETLPQEFPLQAPNAALNVTDQSVPGEVRLGWNSANGIVVDTPSDHFNFLGIVFRNISGVALVWEAAPQAGNSVPAGANVYQVGSQQSLVCKPTDEQDFRECSNPEAFAFTVRPSSVPEPMTITLWLFGLALAAVMSVSRARLR